jgi:hypothetical protein
MRFPLAFLNAYFLEVIDPDAGNAKLPISLHVVDHPSITPQAKRKRNPLK